MEAGLSRGLPAGRASVPRPAVVPARESTVCDPATRHRQCLLWGTRAVHDSDSTSLPEPHHGGRSTSGARVPLPDPVGPAPVRPVGQRSRETGERVRKAAAQFQGRDSDGSHGDCRRSLPRGQKTTVRAMGDSRPSVGTGAPSFSFIFPKI